MTVKKNTLQIRRLSESATAHILLNTFCLLILIFLSAVLPIRVMAQQDIVQVGSRVKLDVPTKSGEKLIGNISSLTDTTMFLDVGSSIYMIPVSSIEEISVSTGIITHKREGAIIGLIAGGSIGSILGFLTYEPCVEEFLAFNCMYRSTSRNNAVLRGASLGVVSGALIGRLIGSIETDRWEKVPDEILLKMDSVGTLQPSTHPQLTLRWTIGSKK